MTTRRRGFAGKRMMLFTHSPLPLQLKDTAFMRGEVL
jgi:hypothetical protein